MYNFRYTSVLRNETALTTQTSVIDLLTNEDFKQPKH